MENKLDSNVIATIQNREDPSQNIAIVYVAEKNAFVTSGIEHTFGIKEILIPAYMIVKDLRLMGAILSVILEKISHACETESSFYYVPQFEVLGQWYSLTESGEYMMLEEIP